MDVVSPESQWFRGLCKALNVNVNPATDATSCFLSISTNSSCVVWASLNKPNGAVYVQRNASRATKQSANSSMTQAGSTTSFWPCLSPTKKRKNWTESSPASLAILTTRTVFFPDDNEEEGCSKGSRYQWPSETLYSEGSVDTGTSHPNPKQSHKEGPVWTKVKTAPQVTEQDPV